MSEGTSKQARLIITAVVVIGAILAIVVVPILVKAILPAIIDGQIARFEKFTAEGEMVQAALISQTPYLVSLFMPIWMGLSMFGGVAILVVARRFYEGARWARGVVLLSLAMPSIGGAYMLVPWMNFARDRVGGFPPAVIIMAIGLIPYFTILLGEKSDWKQKVVNFCVFAIVGVQSAHSFSNGHASLRIQWMHPARPLWPEGTPILWLSTQFMWLGTIALILAIYFLGARKQAGWYLALIGGITTTIANYATHVVRHTTLDYFLGGTFGLVIVVLMLIPFFKNRLYGAESTEQDEEAVARAAFA